MPKLDDSILADDRVHTPVNDPRWRESYYFSFFDEKHEIGGFSSIGKRPAKGHSGSINALWGPSIPTLVASEFDTFEQHDDNHLVAGMSYSAEEPYGAWRLAFAGALNDGGVDVECDHDAIASISRSSARKASVRYDLTFTPAYAPYSYPPREEWRDLFSGHVDEIGTISGEIEIDGQTVEIEGRAAKDHSWGVRDWFKPVAWRWVDLVAQGVDELALWRASFDGKRWIEEGAIFSEGQPLPLTGYRETIATGPRPGKPIPTGIEVKAESGTASVHFNGEVVRVVPIFFSRSFDDRRLVSWNDRSLLRCTLANGGTGWANVEFEETLADVATP